MGRFAAILLTSIFTFSAHAFLSVSPSYVSFPFAKVGGFGGSQTVYVSNNSSESLNLSSSHTCSFDYQIMNSCFYIGAYGSCSINITFNPKTEGPQSCSININAFGPNGGFASISINGTGVK